MQTYLPYSDFYKSAACLDKKRLNNQLNECVVLLKLILGEYPGSNPWRNHPVTKMWEDYPQALFDYTLIIAKECHKKGIQSGENRQLVLLDLWKKVQWGFETPWWLGGFIHQHHREKLLFKDKEHYGQFGWTDRANERSWYPVPWGKNQTRGYGDAKPNSASPELLQALS